MHNNAMDYPEVESLGYIIPRGKKVRFFTLGCGQDLIANFMGEGSSSWLHSFHILYAKEATEQYCTKNDSKFVSLERLRDMQETQGCEEGVISFYITATLSYKGQRDGRLNQFMVLIEDGGKIFEYTRELNSKHKRSRQEQHITGFVFNYFAETTTVVFAGSFNPVHRGHVEVMQKVTSLGYTNNFVQISTKHPEKGDTPELVLNQRKAEIEKVIDGSDWEFQAVDAPMYIDKYDHWLCYNDWSTNLVLIVGFDVWEKYHKHFEKVFLDKTDVSILVFNRYTNDPDVELTESPILHRRSFKSYMHFLNESSTKIRKDNEA